MDQIKSFNMTFRTITSPSTKSKSIFAFSYNSVFASSETFVPTTKSCESSGERVPVTKIITLSTSYLFKQKRRRSQIRQTFILKNYGSCRIVSQKLYSISHIFLAIRRISAKRPHVRGVPLSQSRQASRTPFRNPRPLKSLILAQFSAAPRRDELFAF